MCKRIIFFFFLISLNAIADCPMPRTMVNDADKTSGMNFIDTGKFTSARTAIAAAAAQIPPVVLSEEDLCYGFAGKWGSDRYIEKGSRLGWCQIELHGDLTYKGYRAIEKETSPPNTTNTYTNPSLSSDPTRDIYDPNYGVDWPMLDCTAVPPKCDTGFAALRISNQMMNSTSSGIINGDKSSIVQNWTCIKI